MRRPRARQERTLAWSELHQEELMPDWCLVSNGEEPFKIEPLKIGGSYVPSSERGFAARRLHADGCL
ncbi:MAG: hypothetical protein DMF76_11620 [Acidobacteria bacterium]|nr:MAG: hypothetical protein DMF76_11620 [Acidobacteriota bacterium]